MKGCDSFGQAGVWEHIVRRTWPSAVAALLLALLAGCSWLPTAPKPPNESESSDDGAATTKSQADLAEVEPGEPVVEAALQMVPGLNEAGGNGTEALLERFIADQARVITDRKTLAEALMPDLGGRVREQLDSATGECAQAAEATAQRVARVQAGRETLLGAGSYPEQAARLAERLEVVHPERTTILLVRLRSRATGLAADLVNSVVDSYMLECKRRRREGEVRRLAGLRQRLAGVTARMAVASQAMQQFKQQHPLFDAATAMRRLQSLSDAREKAQIEFLAATALKDQVEKSVGLTADLEREIDRDPAMVSLKASEAALAVDLANAEAERNTTRKSDLEERLKSIRKAIADQRSRLTAQLAAVRKQQVQAAGDTAKAAFEQLSGQADAAAKQAQDAEQLATQWERLTADFQTLAADLQAIQAAVTRTQIALEVAATLVSVMHPAVPVSQ